MLWLQSLVTALAVALLFAYASLLPTLQQQSVDGGGSAFELRQQ
jgi:hypothetical protein